MEKHIELKLFANAEVIKFNAIISARHLNLNTLIKEHFLNRDELNIEEKQILFYNN
jgi:hypothetical protein